MTKQLIDGLRTAAEWIESSYVEYNWDLYSTCNCGILAKVITGLSRKEVTDQVLEMPSFSFQRMWSDKVNYCHQTGLPMPLVITTLLNAGMKVSDFEKLEWLDIPVDQRDAEEGLQKDKSSVISFMRTWADQLEVQLLNQSVNQSNSKVTVSVS